MAHAMSRVRVSNAPASHSLAGCSDCDSFAGMLVLEVRGKCFAAEEAEIVIGVAALVEGGSLTLWVDSRPTKPCCTLPGHSE
jgi:hypothetical protein